MMTRSSNNMPLQVSERRNQHDGIIPMFLEIPGKEMIMNICRAQEIWRDWNEREKPEILFYHSHGEFNLGHCGENGEIGRIDSVISVIPPEELENPYKGSLIGIELKVSVKDLKHDCKLNGKYLQSGMCDYYYVCGFTDDIAAAAMVKYADCYNIGVVSLSSGRVFKKAGKSKTGIDSRKRYSNMLEKRRMAIGTGHRLEKYCKGDSLIAMLITNSSSQQSQILKISRKIPSQEPFCLPRRPSSSSRCEDMSK